MNLNTKKLYMADGYAVKELMKLAILLYQAKFSIADVNVILHQHRIMKRHLSIFQAKYQS